METSKSRENRITDCVKVYWCGRRRGGGRIVVKSYSVVSLTIVMGVKLSRYLRDFHDGARAVYCNRFQFVFPRWSVERSTMNIKPFTDIVFRPAQNRYTRTVKDIFGKSISRVFASFSRVTKFFDSFDMVNPVTSFTRQK